MAVAFDVVGPGAGGTFTATSPVTWTHTNGASATFLIVYIAVGQTSGGADSGYTVTATYNSVSMTASPRQSSGFTGQTGSLGFVQAFTLLNPATGANTVSVTVTGTLGAGGVYTAGSMSFTGAGGIGSWAQGFGNAVGSGSIGVASTTSGNMVAAVVCDGSSGVAFTAGTGRINTLATGNSNSAAGNSATATLASPGGTGTVSWTMTTDDYGVVAVEVKVPAGAATVPLAGARRSAARTPGLPPVRRFRQMLPVPAQLNPPYPFAEVAQHREEWPRGFSRRGHMTVVVPAQVNPPFVRPQISQHREPPAPKAMPRRGRQWTTVPAQVNPPYPVAEIRQWRQPRGFLTRRGHLFAPVPAQQAAAVNPAFTFQQPKHLRMVFLRRGRQFTPVPAQQTAPVAVFVPQAQRHARIMTAPRRGKVTAAPHGQAHIPLTVRPAPRKPVPQRRGRAWQVPASQPAAVAPAYPPVTVRGRPRGVTIRRGHVVTPVPAQVVVPNPAWVQGHRGPLRALAFIRRRWHDLFPWPQAVAPAFSVGTLTASTAAAATLTASGSGVGAGQYDATYGSLYSSGGGLTAATASGALTAATAAAGTTVYDAVYSLTYGPDDATLTATSTTTGGPG